MDFQIHEKLAQLISLILKNKFSLSLSDGRTLASAVLKMSDYYIEKPGTPTPWEEKWCQVAQLAYYLPLNEIRSRAVIARGRQVGFFHFSSALDYGSGLGAGSYTLDIPKQLVEPSAVARHLQEEIIQGQKSSSQIPQIKKNTLGVFSYSLAEFQKLPEWTEKLDGLMIVEPSTQQQGRHLLRTRAELMAKGFSIWAPCTHQMACPLLTHSQSDWCHDRVNFLPPDWWLEMERHLPIKNSSITFSYLLASRMQAPPRNELSRVIGDPLKEKGKIRQMICHGESREFLSWLTRSTIPITHLSRGDIIEHPKEFEKKASEVRPSEAIKKIAEITL